MPLAVLGAPGRSVVGGHIVEGVGLARDALGCGAFIWITTRVILWSLGLTLGHAKGNPSWPPSTWLRSKLWKSIMPLGEGKLEEGVRRWGRAFLVMVASWTLLTRLGG